MKIIIFFYQSQYNFSYQEQAQRIQQLVAIFICYNFGCKKILLKFLKQSYKEQQIYLGKYDKLPFDKKEKMLQVHKVSSNQVINPFDKKQDKQINNNCQDSQKFQKQNQNQNLNQTQIINQTIIKTLFEEELSKQYQSSEFEEFIQDKSYQNKFEKFTFHNQQLKQSNSISLSRQKDYLNYQKYVFLPLPENKNMYHKSEKLINSQISQYSDLNQIKSQVSQQNIQENFVTFNQINTSLQVSNFSKFTKKSVGFYECKNQQNQKQINEKQKILKGLKPLFLEMKIIKNVFQNLERLVNYKIESQYQNSQDQMNTLFHFAKAKETFQQLKNQTGLGRCYFNLGIIHLIKYDYNLASEYFESAIQMNLEIIGINHENLINYKIINQDSHQSVNHLNKLSL
ncbi:tetratricopeptide repeat protein (macronuclear) [Tetrahymena thermophila SB210]|uniref:Tetratricopeptide repeat protein n=1 Tax=Tetrahymena thermophila (strain SB210) TaxID=312017 RepID=Q24HU9_TETTS|nr:tetratricopeptide repeat protein [Tetrahymena thermophila SB210]EAS07338.3 tetratricopeptide repeat protein [Tetrahymena thermophila SB210]|eukprot:XP_001027580.3 tetratricopeptide repeat protein [Tetrahymena thermophila SB210]